MRRSDVADRDKEYRKRSIDGHSLRPETMMMRYAYEPPFSEVALTPPIFQTSTFVRESAQEGKDFFEVAYGLREPGRSEEIGLIYSRINNPNLQLVEERLCLLA